MIKNSLISVPPVWKKPLDQYAGLWYLGMWVCGLGSLCTALLVFLDVRMLSGEPVWFKPTKFFLSIGVFLLTLDWGLRFLLQKYRLVEMMKRVVVYGMWLEIIVIVLQAARGVKSHFNVATWYDAIFFSTMGLAITSVMLACLVLVWKIYKYANGSRLWREAFLLGFSLLVFTGFSSGFIMSSPTPEQIARVQKGETVSVIGSHFLGSKEGETRIIPVLGWSMESGDMRVSHFLGMHMVQVLLLIVFFRTGTFYATRSSVPSSQSECNKGLWMVRVSAVLGFILVVSTLMQALSSESFFTISGFWSVLNTLIILALVVIVLLSVLSRVFSNSK